MRSHSSVRMAPLNTAPAPIAFSSSCVQTPNSEPQKRNGSLATTWRRDRQPPPSGNCDSRSLWLSARVGASVARARTSGLSWRRWKGCRC
jgi:hypothetical protein